MKLEQKPGYNPNERVYSIRRARCSFVEHVECPFPGMLCDEVACLHRPSTKSWQKRVDSSLKRLIKGDQ